jgi:hypothetical protein
MRGFDWDLIRGGHYGQRSCEPHEKAEHKFPPRKIEISDGSNRYGNQEAAFGAELVTAVSK